MAPDKYVFLKPFQNLKNLDLRICVYGFGGHLFNVGTGSARLFDRRRGMIRMFMELVMRTRGTMKHENGG